MASYTIATETALIDERLRQIYRTVKAGFTHFSYEELDTIFEIALNNRSLFPGINLAGANNPEAYIERWVSEYRNAIINPPHSRIASPKSACSDPAIRTIVMVTQGVSEATAFEKEQAHNLFMSAENVQGNLLEEYISVSTRPYGWIWCAGNTLRAIDFCSSDGAVLLQVKNKSNTENSSSSNIRQGTTILKWYRLGTRTVRGRRIPSYKWDALNTIINDHRTLFHLPPCNMTEEHYIQFISNLANPNRELITAEWHMRVITVQEPWASLIAANIKKIETRSWPCLEFGDLYIHSGLSKIKPSELRRQEPLKLIPGVPRYGEIFIKTTLSDCVLLTKEYARQIEESDSMCYYCGDFTPGRYAWVLSNVEPIEPIKVRGK